MNKPKSKRGFAAMSKEMQRQICAMGGKTVSRNRKHMSQIGAAGGFATQKRIRSAMRAAKKAN